MHQNIYKSIQRLPWSYRIWLSLDYERYTPRSLNAERELSEHKKRIEQEELLAKGYKSVFSNILTG